jgi:hypothetical protein
MRCGGRRRIVGVPTRPETLRRWLARLGWLDGSAAASADMFAS